MAVDESSGVHVTVDNSEEEGVSGKAAAWIGFICLMGGIIVGAWVTARFLKFEPSRAHVARIARLEVQLERSRDSLAVVDEVIDAVDDEIESLVVERDRMSGDLAELRAEADALRSQADSLEGSSDLAVVQRENVVLRQALEARELECAFCAESLRQRDFTIARLQDAVALRDDKIHILELTNESLEHALDSAQQEIERATGSLGRWKWVAGGVGLVFAGVLVMR